MIVLGYDARERWCPRDRLWPQSRVAEFLLVDVPKPLSVDVFCWPSVFADPQLAVLGLDDLQLGPKGLAAPSWRGTVQDLWQDVAELDAALAATDGRPHDVIAVTTQPGLHPAAPGAHLRGSGWTCLGWDVADGWLLSGLSNCGYVSGERDPLHADWAHRLNVHHLFAEEGDAAAFAELTSIRVPEHAPFFAYGIWRRVTAAAAGPDVV